MGDETLFRASALSEMVVRMPKRKRLSPSERLRAQWREQVRKTAEFLRSLPSKTSVFGSKWVEGMANHYLRRLVDMLDNPPTGCETEVAKYRRVLRDWDKVA